MALLLSFGIIADVQYADEDDAYNFAKTSKRFYRSTLDKLEKAVEEWNNTDISFVLQVGDLIDGKCNKYSERALNDVFEKTKLLKTKLYHTIGNHELYNFGRDDIQRLLLPGSFYYDFSPCDGFRFIVLNSYDNSVLWKNEGDSAEEHYLFLEANNPNPVRDHGVDWKMNLEGVARRFIPYNGGFSKQQIEWLDNILTKSQDSNEIVYISSHCSLQEGCSSTSTLAWNYNEILEIIQKYSCVVCCFYGHDHKGGFCTDDIGIHHITLPSPLETSLDSNAYAIINVHNDRCEILGRGDVISRVLPYRERK